MNGVELIEEVLDTAADISFDEEDALKYLNQGLSAMARKLLLPGLSNGYSTVYSLTDSNKVALPADYAKGLYACQVAGSQVTVYSNVSKFFRVFQQLNLAAGSIAAVSVQGGFLVYQRVPSVAKEIELFYYRKPEPIEESEQSRPAGLADSVELSEDFDNALINYALHRIYEKIEQGEASKPDTIYHFSQYQYYMAEVDSGIDKQRPRPEPTVCRVSFP